MNLEPWGKRHVSPSYLFCSFSLVSSNHHLHCSIVQLGHLFAGKKTTTLTPALSPGRAFWVADGLSTIPMVTIHFPQAEGVKRMEIPCVGVGLSLSYTILLVGDVLSSRSRIEPAFIPPLPIVKGALASSWRKDPCFPTLLVCLDCGTICCFILIHVVGFFCVFSTFCFGCVFFFHHAQFGSLFFLHFLPMQFLQRLH